MDYEQINITIFDVNVTNLPFIITEETFGHIDADNTLCYC